MLSIFRRFDWRKSKAHWLLLSKFLRPRTVADFTQGHGPLSILGMWTDVLQESPAKAIERFQKEGLICRANLAGHLAYKLKVTDLKDALRQRGLKVSGRKDALIARLIEADPASAQRLASGVIVLTVTEAGRPYAEQYVRDERQRREAAETATRQALGAQRFEEASRVMSEYERGLVFPIGLTVSMGPQGSAPNRGARPLADDVWSLRVIYNCHPAILKGVRQEAWPDLRLAAGMAYLWASDTRQHIPRDLDTGTHLDAATAARMVLFYMRHQAEIARYRSSGVVKAVRILATRDSCPACKKLQGRTYTLGRVPELPYAHCTCEMGCRCTLLPITAPLR